MAHSAVLMCQCIMDGNTLKRRLSDCGMNFNVNTKTAACDLSRHRRGGASRSEVQFIPTSEPHQLESGLQKSGGLPVRLAKACACAWTPTIIPRHQRLLTVHSPKFGKIRKPPLGLKFLGCGLTAARFIILAPLSGHANRSSALNLPAGIHSLGLLWLLSGFYSAQRRMAEYSNSSWQSHQLLMPSFPHRSAATHRSGLDCLFTICCGNPQFFVAINNWAVWSGHSTKGCSIHCEAWGGGSPSSASRGGHTRTRARAFQHGGDLGALDSLPLQLSLPLRATSLPLCLHSATFLSPPQSEERPAFASWDALQIVARLALIELLFLFGGSCLVSPSLYLALASLVVQAATFTAGCPSVINCWCLRCRAHGTGAKRKGPGVRYNNGSCWIMWRDVTWWCWVERHWKLYWAFPW